MLFNSWQFGVFFVFITGLYFLLPQKYRWALLLTASCFFYMAFIPAYILILAATIIVDYFAGIYIERSKQPRRSLFLALSIVANVGFLAFFKYFNFLNDNIAFLARTIHWNYPISALFIILPIGLSFHTFQAMSYTIEVFRGKQKAERHFGIYALYVLFYPQLVAGPIERPQNLIHQFYEEHFFDYQRVADGLKLMVWGLFKKVVIADRLAILVNQVYNNPTDYTGLSLIIATVFFAFQIYCDFSGYSDIAIGAAQVMGFKLMDNFNRPYFSKSISEFWKRWHISLSSWFRDYFYISIGGNRVPRWKWQFNLFLTFLISGLWHGANWTYVLWGALNGFYLVFSLWTGEMRKRVIAFTGLAKMPVVYKAAQVTITFSLVCFAWIFFRARNVSEALYIATHIFDGLNNPWSVAAIKKSMAGLGFANVDYAIAFASIGLMEYVHLIQRHGKIRAMFSEKPAWFRWAIYYVLVIWIILFGVFNQSQFIYFQF
ncbi:MAG: MBOAT family protein [Candidatus Margulisbacteria bacterium]|nr:MBOAT family protein [Candidatus Margulisiibacteriota bacterium]